MILDFLKFLGEAKAKYAFVATYDFDAQFFERRILMTRSFEASDKIVVFMDDCRYRELLEQGRQGSLFDRRYFVVPIRCERGVFHPKLFLTIGDQACLASVGSNNCTASGTGHNFELISTFRVNLDGSDSSPHREVCASLFQLFRRIALDAGPISKVLEKEIFDHIERDFSWLVDANPTIDTDELEVLSNFETSLWEQIVARLGTRPVEKITLCAPFYDQNLSIIERSMAVWPNAKIEIVAQPQYSNLPSARLEQLQLSFPGIHLLSANPQKAGRNLHAKALAFETPIETFWLTGSANISHAAFAGGNREVCLWFSARQRPSEVFAHEDLALVGIKPNEFEEAPIIEPSQSLQSPHGLLLRSTRLTEDGNLRGAIELPPNASDIKINLVRLREQHPFVVRTLGNSTKDFTLSLDEETCRSFDRPVLAYLQAKIDDEMIVSSSVSVAQLTQLLRSRDGVGGSGNRLNRIADTGEGLVEYADTLSGLDETIDFYKNVNIRFDDGSGFGGRKNSAWRGRDPFTGDVPASWVIGSHSGSVAELREAIWNFVERHFKEKLQKHVARGNLNGLVNFMDIYRTLSGLLLSYHYRDLGGEEIIPHPYVTSGLQQILSSLIGSMPASYISQLHDSAGYHKSNFSSGFVRSILKNLGGNEELVMEQLARQRIVATAVATVEELIRIRSVALQRSTNDEWSTARRRWVSEWIATIGVEAPSATEVDEVGTEFRKAA